MVQRVRAWCTRAFQLTVMLLTLGLVDLRSQSTASLEHRQVATTEQAADDAPTPDD